MCWGPREYGGGGQVGGRKGPLRVRSSSCRLQGRRGPTGQVNERNMVGRGSGGGGHRGSWRRLFFLKWVHVGFSQESPCGKTGLGLFFQRS